MASYQSIRRLLPASTSASLLLLAAFFLILIALGLTLSPAVRDRSFDVLGELRWSHWLGVAVWIIAFFFVDRASKLSIGNRDPFIVPVAGLLSGWGLLTIWRLTTVFGFRQVLWIAISAAAFIFALKYKDQLLPVLRRYKYLWLLLGFVITALTFFFGTNPSGIGPHLWLGCCGVYFQPAELLKLLLIVYLAAYLADRQPLTSSLLPLLAPTALMTGVALLLLMIQRDLGTAWVFIFIYTIMIYIAAADRRVLLASLLILVFALFTGYELVTLVHLRVESWLNPWLDPSGSSYQIVQALLAIAAGGIFGRGPGLGSPGFVPVSHSDFIFTSIAEESGLLGAMGLLLLIALLSIRALRISMFARDAYQRYLAAGLGAYFATQSLLIIGGTIRMLPLTGVTLPFVSYGGSSMLISFFGLLMLGLISHDSVNRSTPLLRTEPTLFIARGFLAATAIAALITGWWAVARGPDLLTRGDNARRALSDRYVSRGALLDSNGNVLTRTIGEAGEYVREYLHPKLSSVLGYSHPTYGQAGLENGLDPILRGEEYQPSLSLWNHVLYGQPSPGLDVRLSLDLDLETKAADLLGDRNGAVIVIEPTSGEILAMVSSPTFDANTLDVGWQELLESDDSPLLNRAAQGAYPPGATLGPFLLAAARAEDILPNLPSELGYSSGDVSLDCIRNPADPEDWDELIAAACPGALAEFGVALGSERLLALFDALGFFTAPAIELDLQAQANPMSLDRPGAAAAGVDTLRISPLQLALAASALSNYGVIPAPKVALEIEDPAGGWQPFLFAGEPRTALNSAFALSTAQNLANPNLPIWELIAEAIDPIGRTYTWYLAGTLSGEAGYDRVVVVLLELDYPALARAIGRALIIDSDA
ncbi:MAG: FtsW/RodA/SpoVE family cell cycle protein [Anaerolineales bacterium]